MICRELSKHQRDLIVQKYQSGEGHKKNPGIRFTMGHSKNSHHQVEKIWHNCDSTKNWASLQIDEKMRRKVVRKAAKRPKATLKELWEFLANTGCVLQVTTS